MNKSVPMSPEQQNAQREQIIINTRLTALQAAQDMMKVNATDQISAGDLIAYAKSVEAYIVDGIEAIKPKSTLVLQANMPPDGVFKTGK